MKTYMCNTAIIFYSAQQEQREDMVLPVVEEPMPVKKTKERNESKDKNMKKKEKDQENKNLM